MTQLEIGQTVEVGDPRQGDLHEHSFVGTIVAIDILVFVEDQDGNVFQVEPDQCEVSE